MFDEKVERIINISILVLLIAMFSLLVFNINLPNHPPVVGSNYVPPTTSEPEIFCVESLEDDGSNCLTDK